MANLNLGQDVIAGNYAAKSHSLLQALKLNRYSSLIIINPSGYWVVVVKI